MYFLGFVSFQFLRTQVIELNIYIYVCIYVPLQFAKKQGIWGGMIFGGTAVQTVILAIKTVNSDWDREVKSIMQCCIKK